MRQRRTNVYFTFLYPGYAPGKGDPAKDAPYVAIPNSGEFVSICTDEGCAVFHSPEELRELAEVLNEAADLYENNQAKRITSR